MVHDEDSCGGPGLAVETGVGRERGLCASGVGFLARAAVPYSSPPEVMVGSNVRLRPWSPSAVCGRKSESSSPRRGIRRVELGAHGTLRAF